MSKNRRTRTGNYTLPDDVIAKVKAMATEFGVSESKVLTWALLDWDSKHDNLAPQIIAETHARQRIAMQYSRPEPPKPRKAKCGSAPRVDWGKLISVGPDAPWGQGGRFEPATQGGQLLSVFVTYDDKSEDSTATTPLVTARIRAGIKSWKKKFNMNDAVFHSVRCISPLDGGTAFEVWRER